MKTNFITHCLLLLLGSSLYATIAVAQKQQPSTPATNAEITVTEKGFEPSSVTVRANAPAQITFLRKNDKTCATEVVVPEYNIKRELPLNRPVVIEITPKKAGEIGFSCGMGMFRGTIVARQQ